MCKQSRTIVILSALLAWLWVGCQGERTSVVPPEGGSGGGTAIGGAGGAGGQIGWGGAGGAAGSSDGGAGEGGNAGEDGSGGTGEDFGCTGDWDKSPGSICAWICDDTAWVPIDSGPMRDCKAMEAVADRIPLDALTWNTIGIGREEAPIPAIPSRAWNGMLSAQAGKDGPQVLFQFGQAATCGADAVSLRRLVDLATLKTIGVYRTIGYCDSGTFAQESAPTGGIGGNNGEGTSYLLLGSRKQGDEHWSWWPEPMHLNQVYKIHDLADGTLVLRTPASIQVALSRETGELTTIEGESIFGTAYDDVFVWSQLLSPVGSRIRTWSREHGVRTVLEVEEDDICPVAVGETRYVWVTGWGNCLSYRKELRFWWFPADANGETAGPIAGPYLPQDTWLGLRRLMATDTHAAVFAAEDSYDENRLFVIVWRFSDNSLWRINPRPGMTLYGPDMALDSRYLYVTERFAKDREIIPSAQRLSLEALESYAIRYGTDTGP